MSGVLPIAGQLAISQCRDFESKQICIPEMKPSFAIPCAFEIFSPLGFIASTADAENAEGEDVAAVA